MPRPLPALAYRCIAAFGTSRVVTRLHPIAYRLTGGRGPIGRNLGVTNVVLSVTGRRSGRVREVPLYAFPDADRWVVVASDGGAAADPAWVRNLRAAPSATLRVGRAVRPVRAREAAGEERTRLWELVVEGYPGYALYQAGTARTIPVVVLEPHPASAAPAPPGDA